MKKTSTLQVVVPHCKRTKTTVIKIGSFSKKISCHIGRTCPVKEFSWSWHRKKRPRRTSPEEELAVSARSCWHRSKHGPTLASSRFPGRACWVTAYFTRAPPTHGSPEHYQELWMLSPMALHEMEHFCHTEYLTQNSMTTRFCSAPPS